LVVGAGGVTTSEGACANLKAQAQCVEEDHSLNSCGGTNSDYEIGAEYIVLLTGSGPRFGGLGDGERAFPVRGQTVTTNGFMGLGQTTALRDVELKLRQLPQ
jgi:hypothetical protein